MKTRNGCAVLVMVVAAAAGVRAGWGDTTVNFGIKWQDYGGTAHPLQFDNASFYDFLTTGTAGPPFAGPIATDATGAVQLVTAYNNADSSNNLNVPAWASGADQRGWVRSIRARRRPIRMSFFRRGTAACIWRFVNGTTSYNNVSFTNSSDAAKTLEVSADCEVHEGFLRRCGEL